MIQVVLSPPNFGKDLASVFALEWQVATHEHVEEHSEGPHVTLVVVVAVKDFGGHIIGRAGHIMQLLSSLRPLGQPKINDLDLVIRRNHDVLGLDVPVDDALGVYVVQGTEELFHIVRSHVLRENLVLLRSDLFKKFAAANELHDEVDVLLVDVGLIVAHNVRMVQLGQDFYFLLDGIQMIIQLRLVHHLDRHDVLLVVLVEGLEDFSEGAGAQNLRLGINLVILLELLGALLLPRAQRERLLLPKNVCLFVWCRA